MTPETRTLLAEEIDANEAIVYAEIKRQRPGANLSMKQVHSLVQRLYDYVVAAVEQQAQTATVKHE